MLTNWKEKLAGSKVEVRIWQSVSMIFGAVIVGLTFVVCYQSIVQVDEIKSQRTIILDDRGKHLVESKAEMSDAYISSVHSRIVHLMESWTYKNVESNYNELFNFYFGTETKDLVEANILSSNFYNKAKENKMISLYTIDEKRSKHTWCTKIGRACSLIVGDREVFLNHNEPDSKKTVAYLIFSRAVFPKTHNEYALRVKRLIIDDSSSNPIKELEKKFLRAQRGNVEDVNML